MSHVTTAGERVRDHRRATLVGLFVALFGLFLTNPVVSALSPDDVALALALDLGQHWLLAGVVVAVVLFWERRPLASVRVTDPSARDLGWGVVGFVVGALSFVATIPVVEALELANTSGGVARLAELSVAARILVAVTAGVSEEVLFRGYAIERLEALTGNTLVAATLPLTVFTAAHVFAWGVGGALQIGAWTLVVTALYLWRRNLQACVLMHVLNDVYAFVLVPAFFL